MKKNILLFLFAIIGYASHAQTGIGTLNPHASSALDISLANKGVLLSRVALKGTTDTSTIPSPANSLLVYNTATINDITQGYYYWSTMSSRWIRVIDTASIVPAWNLTGNSNTVAGTNFIGTLDNQDLVFKRNNIQAGRLTVFSTSFGLSALKNNLSGRPNTAIGNEALESNIGGESNTAVGYRTLKNSTESSANSAFGHSVLESLVKGYYNVGVGMHSLQDLKEGTHNTAVGRGALNYMTGSSYNIGIGSGAGARLHVGDNNLYGFNTIIGSYNNNDQGLKSGINNTILGSRISLLGPISNNIIIADGEGNRRINVNELGNVGLGTTTPHASAALHIG
ncbi:hypothetical protein LNQ49_23180, partial [Flavobacterium sp. F-65]|nr:hypothetical protein [Flavobacterium sp. F-65]